MVTISVYKILDVRIADFLKTMPWTTKYSISLQFHLVWRKEWIKLGCFRAICKTILVDGICIDANPRSVLATAQWCCIVSFLAKDAVQFIHSLYIKKDVNRIFFCCWGACLIQSIVCFCCLGGALSGLHDIVVLWFLWRDFSPSYNFG